MENRFCDFFIVVLRIIHNNTNWLIMYGIRDKYILIHIFLFDHGRLTSARAGRTTSPHRA